MGLGWEGEGEGRGVEGGEVRGGGRVCEAREGMGGKGGGEGRGGAGRAC